MTWKKHENKMDHDLLFDIYGFIPEKYFLHRILSKQLNSGHTKISFVDYERRYYKLNIHNRDFPRSKKVEWRKGSRRHQEYGPSNSIGYNYYHMINGRMHRVTGPALVIRDHSACRWVHIPPVFFLCFEGEDPLISISSSYNSKRIRKVWLQNGIVTKIELFPIE